MPWITKDNFAFSLTERYNVCDDDTFIQIENSRGVACEENSGKSLFHNGREKNRKTFMLLLYHCDFHSHVIV